MPRIDNSSEEMITYFDLDFDPDDPGNTPPVDLCTECFCRNAVVFEGYVIDHPDYGDDKYYCFECEDHLHPGDNEVGWCN